MYTVKNRLIARLATLSLLCVPLVTTACTAGGSQTATPTAIPTASLGVPTVQPTDTAVPAAPPTDTTAPATATEAPTEAATPTQAAQPSPTTPQSAGGPSDYRWSQVGLAGQKIQDIAIPAGSTEALAAGPGGVWKAGYSYTAWTPMNVKLSGRTSGVAAAGPDAIIVTSNTGCASGAPAFAFRSKDAGDTWQPVTSQVIPFRVVIANSQLAFGTTCSGVAKSTDAGATWTAIPNSGITNYDPGAIAIGPDGKSIYVAYYSEGGVARIMRSNEDGTAWTEITPKGVELRAPVIFATAPVTQGHPEQGGVYMATSPGQVWFLQEGAADWAPGKANNPKSDKPEADYQITALYVDTTNTEEYNKPGPVLYAARALPGNSAMQPLGVFRSTNGGQTWDQMGTGIEKQVVNSLVLAPQNLAVAARTIETLLAGTDDGVWSAPLPPPFH